LKNGPTGRVSPRPGLLRGKGEAEVEKLAIAQSSNCWFNMPMVAHALTRKLDTDARSIRSDIHNERNGGAYNTGTKRKARKDWLVTRSTHEPLITDDEAEAILKQVERGQERRTRATARE